MKTIDEGAKRTKRINILQGQENFVKKEADLKNRHNEPQLFHGEWLSDLDEGVTRSVDYWLALFSLSRIISLFIQKETAFLGSN